MYWNNHYLCSQNTHIAMLLSFTVDNYRSFGKAMTLDLTASNGIKDNPGIGITPISDTVKVLNAVAFYGANSSGKSNFLRAIATMRRIIVQSVRLNENETLPYDPFVLTTATPRPTRFEAVLYHEIEKTTYKYGFEYNAEAITNEWLNSKAPRKSQKDLFSRTRDNFEIDEANFTQGISIENKQLNKNRLLLSLAGQLGVNIANQIIALFQKDMRILSGIEDSNYSSYTRRLVHENEEYKVLAREFLRSMNLGFNEFETTKVEFEKLAFPPGLPAELIAEIKGRTIIEVSSFHRVYDSEDNPIGYKKLNLDENESAGTNKIFNLTGPILEALKFGNVLVIDELDSQLHPLLSWRLIQLFNNPDRNHNGAQLLFSTHDTHLLSNRLFRRDQIWFLEKDPAERSVLFPMMMATEKLGHTPRNDSNYQKNYINGLYGAIPFPINDSPE